MSATNGIHQEHAPAAATEPAPTPSKDEIGWYFVESYYTTLSKTPEKLHLFYNARSQFVTGDEGKTSPVSVGRAAIKERIASLDFADCKVRVSNVDSQATDNEMIVVQVIGETSNKTSELKKFVQTFVLARQPGGYYVQNDIFRYIIDELEEVAAAAETTAVEEATAPVVDEVVESVEEPKAEVAEEAQVPAIDAETVDKKLEQDPEPAILKAQETNGDVEVAETEKEEVPEKVEEPVVEEKEAAKEALVPEVPKDPTPTPVVAKSPPKPAPVVPATPAKPMSWASRAAAAAVAMPRPVVPAVPAPKAAAPAQARAPAQATAQATAAATKAEPSAVKKENEAPQSQGWQTAGADTRRQNRPQSISAQPEDKGTMGYVRNVNATVDEDALRTVLEKFGELTYFDVNRQKNCAFIEYSTPAGYQAAFAANPHKVGAETVHVDPRRPKIPGFPGSFNNNRGGMNNRGRGGFQNRGPGNQNGRGNFGGPARGGAQQRGPRAPAPAAAQTSA